MVRILDLNFQGVEKAIAAFLITSTDGLVLIETGPYSCYRQLENNIKQHSYTLNDIKHVLITHIHLDHAGAAWALAELGAKIYLHPFGESHMQNPEKLWKSAKLIYGDSMETLWGQMRPINPEQLTVVSHGQELKFGDVNVKAWHTPGHANHHIVWQINENVFCGDVAGVKIQEGPVVPPCPPPDINLDKWQQSIALVKGLAAKKLFLTHFGAVVNVNEHLDELWETLNSWAQWIKPRFDNGEKVNDIIPDFQSFTANQLKSKGVDVYGLKQYETANPSWMSVSGLMRYWKKKAYAEE